MSTPKRRAAMLAMAYPEAFQAGYDTAEAVLNPRIEALQQRLVTMQEALQLAREIFADQFENGFAHMDDAFPEVGTSYYIGSGCIEMIDAALMLDHQPEGDKG